MKGNRRYYIQVADHIGDEETRNKELKPYLALNDQIQKVIVINKPVNEMLDAYGFTIIRIYNFLMLFIK